MDSAPTDPRPELLVVMPVYNEQAAVGNVVAEWFAALDAVTREHRLLAINDGSTDATLTVLRSLQARFGPRLEVLDQPNRGHGQCCLQGYRMAVARRVPYVLQIDSDGQCDPRYFAALWRRRRDADVVYGRRVRRDDGWQRSLASAVVRWLLLAVCGVRCVDANVPYRLMRSGCLPPSLARVPADFSLANVALAVLLRQDPAVRETSVPIGFRQRAGGQPSVPLRQFGRKARELYRQLRCLPGGPAAPDGLALHSATLWGGEDAGGASQRP